MPGARVVLMAVAALLVAQAAGVRRRLDPIQSLGKADELTSDEVDSSKGNDETTEYLLQKAKDDALKPKETKKDTTTEPPKCPGTPPCNDQGTCGDDGMCVCDDGWKDKDCSKSSFPSGKKIPTEGSGWRMTVPPELLEECALTTNAKAGQCPAYSLAYRFLCSRFVDAINDKGLYQHCRSSSVDTHLKTCTAKRHLEAFASCPALCASLLDRWCRVGLEQQKQKEDSK